MNQLRLEKIKDEVGVDGASNDDRDAIAALVVDDARVLARLPPKTAAANINAALDREPPRSMFRSTGHFFVAPAVAIAAVLCVFVVVPKKLQADDLINGAIGDRIKGDAQPVLLISREHNGEAQALSSWDIVHTGDVVQVRTKGAGFAHGVVVSVDGAGVVTRHFPDDGSSTTLPTGTTALPFSFELDDAPGFERFFLVASNAALDVKAVEEAAAATARSKDPRKATLHGLPDGAVQSDFLLVKE